MHEGGGNCVKYCKWCETEKRGSGNKDFKKGVKLGQGVGALKSEAGTPLRTMVNLVCFVCKSLEFCKLCFQ